MWQDAARARAVVQARLAVCVEPHLRLLTPRGDCCGCSTSLVRLVRALRMLMLVGVPSQRPVMMRDCSLLKQAKPAGRGAPGVSQHVLGDQVPAGCTGDDRGCSRGAISRPYYSIVQGL